jgi:hypothetical protein
MYMYTGFCILSILWKQKEENIDVHVYWVLYSQYSLETERRKHRCTCILSSVFSVFSGNRKKENTENTEPSIHVHLCFLLSVSREYWEYRTQYTCTSMFSSFCFQRILRIQNPVYMYIYVFFFLFPENTENTEPSMLSVFSGNRKKKT